MRVFKTMFAALLAALMLVSLPGCKKEKEFVVPSNMTREEAALFTAIANVCPKDDNHSKVEYLTFFIEGWSFDKLPPEITSYLTEYCANSGANLVQLSYEDLVAQRLRALLTLEYDGAVPEPAAITTLLERPELVVEKRTKRGMAETDIRPMLHAYHVEAAPGALLLTCEVSAQEPSLNPMLLAAAIERYLPGAKPDFVRCRRLEMLDEQGGIFR